jgi:hypothetical protein
MNKFLRSILFKGLIPVLVLLYFSVQFDTIAFAQVKFSAVCPNKKISKNEYLQVQFIVENATNVQQVIPPSFKNFSIVSGPNHQSGISNINGNIKQYISIEFILKPRRYGNFTLGPATAKADGKILRSNSLSVEVSNNSTDSSSGGASFSPFANIISDISPPPLHRFDDYILRQGENLQEKIKKNLFIKVIVSKTNCYVGEPIMASYKLYTRLKSESNLTKSPSLNGFSVSELEMADDFTLNNEKYNGRDYSVYTLRKVQLYPLQPGIIELEPIEVENRITFLKAAYANEREGEIFFDMLRDFAEAASPREAIEEQKVTLQSKPVSIMVKPLPYTNEPKEFRGAVGNFNINAIVQKSIMDADEAGNLVVTVSGSGNIQMVNAPNVLWPEGVEAFEPKLSENIDKAAVPIRGEKIFMYPFTVSKPGSYVIPAISFSYFDVTDHAYKTTATKPVTVTAKKRNLIRQIITSPFRKKENTQSEKLLHKIYKQRLVLLAAILVLTGSLVWFIKSKKRKSNTSVIDKKTKNPAVIDVSGDEGTLGIPKNPLYEAEEMLLENNPNKFYYAINNCLRKYLSVKLKYPENELGKKKINELLDRCNVGIGTTLMLTSLLENIELNLYAPASSANHMQEVYEKASEVVSLLDKQVC